jgi:hypothetical protein
MLRTSRFLFLLVGVLLALTLIFLATPVAAGTVSWTSPDGTVTITYHVPNDYGACAPADTVYTTGLPQNWRVMGQYSFWDMSVTPAVRLSPDVNQSFVGTDLQQPIVYPAWNSWPVVDAQAGERAIWVKALAVVFNERNQGVAQLYGGRKWMVTCVEACLPTYWKSHVSSWAGYSPGADFDTTFGVDYFNPDINLISAVYSGGGGLNELARYGVANLLNASHPNIQFAATPEEVIGLVQAGDSNALLNLAPDYAVCPLP